MIFTHFQISFVIDSSLESNSGIRHNELYTAKIHDRYRGNNFNITHNEIVNMLVAWNIWKLVRESVMSHYMSIILLQQKYVTPTILKTSLWPLLPEIFGFSTPNKTMKLQLFMPQDIRTPQYNTIKRTLQCQSLLKMIFSDTF